MFQPIGQEQAFKAARIGGAQRIQRGQRRRTIRCPGFWAHHRQACGGFFGGQEGQRIGFTLLRRRGQQRHGAGFALGHFQDALRMSHAPRPIRRGGPAIIQHQQKRAGLAGAGAGLPDGPREAQNDQARHNQAQQQQPPGRARWRGLGGLQFA